MPPQKLVRRSRRAPLSRSEIMSRIRSKDTAPERRVASCLHAMGIRYRRNSAHLAGKPDFANKKQGWVIFVHGCFWHRHEGCALASSPRTNRDYWVPKLKRNEVRDATAAASLKAGRFRVFVVWECETREAATLAKRMQKIGRAIARGRSRCSAATPTITKRRSLLPL